jgi:hypothetical protein
VELTHALLLLAVAGVEGRRLGRRWIAQGAGDADGARGVEHVGGDRAVARRDLDRGVLAAGGRAPDEQGHGHAATLHLLGDVGHLVERRGDQAREADEVDLLGGGGVEDLFARGHDPEVDHLVAVAGEHHADDVLADVVHVALHRRQQHLARGRRSLLLRLHERQQVGDRLLHGPRRLDHLRQEHLAGGEEIADHAHAGHERPLDHLERALRRRARLLDVGHDEVDDAVHQGVLEPLADRRLAPREIELLLLAPCPSPARRARPAARWRRRGG